MLRAKSLERLEDSFVNHGKIPTESPTRNRLRTLFSSLDLKPVEISPFLWLIASWRFVWMSSSISCLVFSSSHICGMSAESIVFEFLADVFSSTSSWDAWFVVFLFFIIVSMVLLVVRRILAFYSLLLLGCANRYWQDLARVDAVVHVRIHDVVDVR
jgi:hypothetical protein